MLDCKGTPVQTGSKVVVLSGAGKGDVGYVHRVSTYPGCPRTPGALVYDVPYTGEAGVPEDMTWGSWLRMKELTVIA